MPKAQLAAALWVALSLGAGAQGRAAHVTKATGSAQAIQGIRGGHAVEVKDRLEAGTSLNVPGNGTVELFFYGDGHLEEISGPCLVRVLPSGCKVVHGGSNCLVRVKPGQRVLVVPPGGNLQSVGGSVSGISDPAITELRDYKKGNPRPPGYSPSAPSRGGGGGGGGSTLSYEQDRDGFVLISMEDPKGLKGSLEGAGELVMQGTKLRVKGKVGQTLLLRFTRGSTLVSKLPVRALSHAERRELHALLNDPKSEDAALIIDRLDQLGQPLLAAQKAEALLTQLDNHDAGLMTYLYELYRDQLVDKTRAELVLERARTLGLKLKP